MSVLPRGPRYGARPSPVATLVILAVVGAVFAIPILGMVFFSLQKVGSTGLTAQHYVDLVTPANESTYNGLFQGIGNSLVICAITVVMVLVLLLPTMILVELRFPRFRRALEFVCILPITIPSIVLVVGFFPVYSVVAQIFGSTSWTLSFAIGIIVLPYAYRPISANIEALEMVTLTEAGRSLGANWARVVLQVIVPNLRRGILSSVFITVAVVLGEFTIASFLSQNTFQTALLLLQQTDPYVAIIFAFFSLLFAFILLLLIGRLGTVGRTRRTS